MRVGMLRTVMLVVVACVVLFSSSAFAKLVPEITIMTTTEAYDAIRYETAFMIADAWEALGFRVFVRPVEFSTLTTRLMDEQDFDVSMYGWGGRVERLDPQHFLGSLYGGQADRGGTNPGGYVNEEYDALFELQSGLFDPNERREVILSMQEIAMSDAPISVLYYRDEVNAYNNERFDNFVVMTGEGLYNEWLQYSVTPLTDKRILTVGTPQEPDNINPLASTTVWGWKFLRLVYDKLVRLSPDIEPIPWAAEEIVPIDDVTVDIILRSGMTFHDGMPVTAEDVKFTFDYYIENDFAYFRPFYRVIERTDVIGENRVRFTLEEPYAPFVTVTLSQIPILPKHIWENIDNPAELAPADIPTVGSGPFMFDRYDRGEYKRILTFWDHFAAEDVEIEGMDYIIFADSEGVLTGLVTKQVDMTAQRMDPGHIPTAERNPHLTLVIQPNFAYHYFIFNTRRTPFDDVNVRRALSHAVNKEAFIDVLMEGLGEPGSSIVAPVNVFWHNPEVEQFEFDLDKARQLLREAGYRWDSQGRILFPEGH